MMFSTRERADEIVRLNELLRLEKAKNGWLLGAKERLSGELKAKNYALAVWRDNAIQQANGK